MNALMFLGAFQQHPKVQVSILSTSSLVHVSDSIYILHQDSKQLWSTSAQDAIVNNLRAVQRSCAMRLLGGVVPLLWVVVLVGLVFALPVSVRVPHFPRCRCCMYLEFSVILVSPNLFLLLRQ